MVVISRTLIRSDPYPPNPSCHTLLSLLNTSSYVAAPPCMMTRKFAAALCTSSLPHIHNTAAIASPLPFASKTHHADASSLCTHPHPPTPTPTNPHTHKPTHPHTHTPTHKHTHKQTQTCTHIYTHTPTHTIAHMHTHTHTHTHTHAIAHIHTNAHVRPRIHVHICSSKSTSKYITPTDLPREGYVLP